MLWGFDTHRARGARRPNQTCMWDWCGDRRVMSQDCEDSDLVVEEIWQQWVFSWPVHINHRSGFASLPSQLAQTFCLPFRNLCSLLIDCGPPTPLHWTQLDGSHSCWSPLIEDYPNSFNSKSWIYKQYQFWLTIWQDGKDDRIEAGDRETDVRETRPSSVNRAKDWLGQLFLTPGLERVSPIWGTDS